MERRQTLENLLQQSKRMVIDGAMSTALEQLGVTVKGGGLWTAEALIDRPDLVKEVHLRYFRAGADCGISCSYQAAPKLLIENGFTRQQAKAIIRKSVELLTEARDEFWDEFTKENPGTSRAYPLALASCGPYGAYLCDGSEYRGRYKASEGQIRSFHETQTEALLGAGADLMLYETVPSLPEAVIEAEIAEKLGVDYWISFTTEDGVHTCEGQGFDEAARIFSDREKFPRLKMIGANCSTPNCMKPVIEALKETGLPVAVYPNSGLVYDPVTQIWTGGDLLDDYRQQAIGWYQDGAAAVGGCCSTTPEQIVEVAKARDAFVSEQ